MSTNKTHIAPMKAQDIIEDKIKFPVLVSPKIDGVWACVSNGELLSRTLSKFGNKHITNLLSNEELNGVRGELIIGENPTLESLCRHTTAALNTYNSVNKFTFYIFDFVTEATKNLPYAERISIAMIASIRFEMMFDKDLIDFIIVDCNNVNNIEEYNKYKYEFLNCSYEGIVIRDGSLKHKEGRSSKKHIHLWRWKPYSTAEIVVTKINEAEHNANEASTDNFGNIKRSSHKQHLQSKGEVGSVEGMLINNLTDCNGKVIKNKGEFVTVSKGVLTEKECKFYFDNKNELLGKVVEFEYFSYGLKDKPRFAVLKRIRPLFDL